MKQPLHPVFESPSLDAAALDALALDALAQAARERPVPWSAERASRVQRNIARERARFSTPSTRFALGGLATVALFASFVCVARAIRIDVQPDGESTASRGPWVAVSEAEPADLERPVGDGGFVDGELADSGFADGGE